MKVEELINCIGSDFFTGVPDSQLKALCDYLMDTYGIDGRHHIIAANEGNAVGIAAGYHLATGKVPVVYMQNSGEGNVINPVASLLSKDVYGIPCIFIIGWRGEPGVNDEPQHAYQGKVTCGLLDSMEIEYFIVSEETTENELRFCMGSFQRKLSDGGSVAFVVRKGALKYDKKIVYKNDFEINREEAIRHIVRYSREDIVVSTTGKISRELFEIRENNIDTHERDFLTVGSMGHCSSIALGVALNKPDKRIWCIEGDGSALMHMGAIPVIASLHPHNLVHIILNNGAHETVGGMPTVMSDKTFSVIANDCGYSYFVTVDSYEMLDIALENVIKQDDLSFIEVKCNTESRSNLGRPTITTKQCKNDYMTFLKKD